MGLAFEMGFLVEEYVFIDFERKKRAPRRFTLLQEIGTHEVGFLCRDLCS